MVQAVAELGSRCLLSSRVVRRFGRRVLRDRGDGPLPIVFQVRCDGRLQAVPRDFAQNGGWLLRRLGLRQDKRTRRLRAPIPSPSFH